MLQLALRPGARGEALPIMVHHLQVYRFRVGLGFWGVATSVRALVLHRCVLHVASIRHPLDYLITADCQFLRMHACISMAGVDKPQAHSTVPSDEHEQT